MLTGSAEVDLRKTGQETAHRRLTCLPQVPDGGRVVVLIGALAPHPHVCRLLLEHNARLSIDIRGEPHAVRRWLDFIRSDLLGGVDR